MGPGAFVVKSARSVEASELKDEVSRVTRHRGRQHSTLILDDILEELPIAVERLEVLGIPHTPEIAGGLRLLVSGEAA